MNKMLVSAGLAAVTIMIGTAANAQDTPSREQQMEAYRAYSAAQGTAPAEIGQAPANANAGASATAYVTTTAPIEPTTTVEKTTTTDYTVRKRKVGLVGGRPFAPKTEEIEGGVVKEVTVNGVETAKEVIKPDPMEGKTVESMDGDYYTGPRGVRAYKVEEEKTDLDVHFTGGFNK